MDAAAYVAVGLLVVIALFQIALALGAPFGKAAWGGGRGDVLPTPFRVASAVAGVVIYPFLALVVLSSAGFVAADWIPGAGRMWMWALTGFFTVGTLANVASRSRPERLWAPVSLVVAICCAVTAAGS